MEWAHEMGVLEQEEVLEIVQKVKRIKGENLSSLECENFLDEFEDQNKQRA
jgi:hypothetical protein